MSVLALGVRDRSFKTVLGGFDAAAVRAALDAAATEFETLETEIVSLRQQHADALREIDRMGDLERSLLRSCVAAEEDALIRRGAARRYAARVIAAAEEQAAVRLATPAHERDRLAREIDAMLARRRDAAAAIEALIADLAQPVALEEDGARDADERDGDTAPDVIAPPAIVKLAESPHHVSDDAGAAQLAAVAPAPVVVKAAWPPGAVAKPASPASSTIAQPIALPGSRVSGGSVKSDAGNASDHAAADAGSNAAPVPLAATAAGTRTGRFRMPIAAGSAAAVLLVLQASSAGAPRFNGPPPNVSAASFAPAMTESASPVSDGVTAPASDAATAAPTPAALTLHIKPLRTCWVRVVVDDRTTDARELQPGEDIVLEAQRSIVVRAGDAGALSIELNGRVLPPLGLKGQVVERRFTAGGTGD